MNNYTIDVRTPTELWLELGHRFFDSRWDIEPYGIVDLKLGDRRFIRFVPTLMVSDWSPKWTGEALLRIVGYSPRGSKMKTLRETYVDEGEVAKLKQIIKDNRKMVFFAAGMNFRMKTIGKGACLSSFHVLKNHKQWWVIVHGKIAEVPRKIVADLRLVADLVRDLGIPGPLMVKFMYSAIYFSIVGLRAYVPILGTKNMDFHDLPITEPRNYQVGSQESIREYRKILKRKYGKQIMRYGMEDKIDLETGELNTKTEKVENE